MLIKASQYFEITSFSINFTSVFINTCDDSQMNLHKDNFLMSFHKHLILLYNTSIMPAFTEEEKSFLASMRKDFVALSKYSHPKEKGKASRIDIISSKSVFRNRSLISYAEERGISLETLESFCSEVIYSIDGIRGRQFYAIGFMNDSGG